MARRTYWTVTDAEGAKAWGANRIRYPGSPRCKRWNTWCGRYRPLPLPSNAISIPPGGTAARLKSKKLTGPHKQRSMWFNSKQREEPYQDLNIV